MNHLDEMIIRQLIEALSARFAWLIDHRNGEGVADPSLTPLARDGLASRLARTSEGLNQNGVRRRKVVEPAERTGSTTPYLKDSRPRLW